MGEPIYSRTETVAGCPKYCASCGNQGLCIDSRRGPEAVMRRYKCQCGRKWNSIELMVEDDGPVHSNKLDRFRAAQRRRAVASLQNELHAVITKFFDSQQSDRASKP